MLNEMISSSIKIPKLISRICTACPQSPAPSLNLRVQRTLLPELTIKWFELLLCRYLINMQQCAIATTYNHILCNKLLLHVGFFYIVVARIRARM